VSLDMIEGYKGFDWEEVHQIEPTNELEKNEIDITSEMWRKAEGFIQGQVKTFGAYMRYFYAMKYVLHMFRPKVTTDASSSSQASGKEVCEPLSSGRPVSAQGPTSEQRKQQSETDKYRADMLKQEAAKLPETGTVKENKKPKSPETETVKKGKGKKTAEIVRGDDLHYEYYIKVIQSDLRSAKEQILSLYSPNSEEYELQNFKVESHMSLLQKNMEEKTNLQTFEFDLVYVYTLRHSLRHNDNVDMMIEHPLFERLIKTVLTAEYFRNDNEDLTFLILCEALDFLFLINNVKNNESKLYVSKLIRKTLLDSKVVEGLLESDIEEEKNTIRTFVVLVMHKFLHIVDDHDKTEYQLVRDNFKNAYVHHFLEKFLGDVEQNDTFFYCMVLFEVIWLFGDNYADELIIEMIKPSIMEKFKISIIEVGRLRHSLFMTLFSQKELQLENFKDLTLLNRFLFRGSIRFIPIFAKKKSIQISILLSAQRLKLVSSEFMDDILPVLISLHVLIQSEIQSEEPSKTYVETAESILTIAINHFQENSFTQRILDVTLKDGTFLNLLTSNNNNTVQTKTYAWVLPMLLLEKAREEHILYTSSMGNDVDQLFKFFDRTIEHKPYDMIMLYCIFHFVLLHAANIIPRLLESRQLEWYSLYIYLFRHTINIREPLILALENLVTTDRLNKLVTDFLEMDRNPATIDCILKQALSRDTFAKIKLHPVEAYSDNDCSLAKDIYNGFTIATIDKILQFNIPVIHVCKIHLAIFMHAQFANSDPNVLKIRKLMVLKLVKYLERFKNRRQLVQSVMPDVPIVMNLLKILHEYDNVTSLERLLSLYEADISIFLQTYLAATDLDAIKMRVVKTVLAEQLGAQEGEHYDNEWITAEVKRLTSHRQSHHNRQQLDSKMFSSL
jgi:hypothetical protein